MNDLAQQTLRVLGTARRYVSAQIAARPFGSLAIAGFLVGWVVVVAGGRVGTVRTAIPLTNWLGLLSRDGVRPGDLLPGTILLAAIVALVLLWLLALRVNRNERCTEATVWGMAAAWSVPFIVGPPLLSGDVYTYAAQGLMARHGFDVYEHGPSVLGNIRAVAAVDPSWRSVPSPYGPLTTVVQHLAIAISGGSPLGAVIVFRALAVVSAVAMGILAAELAGPHRRTRALTMVVLNPLVLLHIVSAAHLEGVMIALLLGALVAANERRWALAIVLASASGSIKAPAYLAVLALIVVHSVDLRGRFDWRTALRDSSVATAAIAICTLLVPNGLGWVKALNTPTLGHTPFAPASLLADVFGPIVDSASYDDRAAGGRITALLAALCIVAYLTVTARRRALNRTVGYGLIAMALLGPVMYPWYLLWGIGCLAPTARKARADWLVLASGLACVFTPTGFNRVLSNTITVVATVLALAMIAERERRRRLRARPAVSAGGWLPARRVRAPW